MLFYAFLAVLILAIGLYVYYLLKEKIDEKKSETSPPPFSMHKSVLDKSELEFYKELIKYVDLAHVILLKVSLNDLFYTTITFGEVREDALKKIANEHADFLICDKQTLKPIYAISLDHSIHLIRNRLKKGKYIDRAYKAAGLKLIRIKIKNEYTAQDFYDLPTVEEAEIPAEELNPLEN